MTTLRKISVSEGRAMIGVLHLESRKPATIGVCPGCWNTKERRTLLTRTLGKMGYAVAYKDDLPEGKYLTGKTHAPGCRHKGLTLQCADPWKRFKAALASSYE
jgi:hypothetical protein